MGIEDFNRFIRGARKQVGTGERLHLVLGNESADLDSIVSSLMYAYLLWAKGERETRAVIPVINIPAREIHHRPEVIYLFSDVGVDITDLVFREAIGLYAKTERDRVEISLVDHNELALHQQDLEDRVIGVIDHHPDSGEFMHGRLRIIEPVASTATLIAEQFLAIGRELLDPALAKLLLGPILLDSVNLSPQAPQYSAKDRRIAERLISLSAVDQPCFHQALTSARTELAHLKTHDLLARDLKLGRCSGFSFGVSVVPLKLETWIEENPDLLDEINRFALDRKQDLFLVMTYHPDPKFERKIIACSSNQSISNGLFSYLNDHDAQITPMVEFPADLETSKTFKFWRQHNTRLSRKHLFPLLKSYEIP